jgi:tRNA-specific 2-thiouridylase
VGARWCGPARLGSFRATAQLRAHGEEVPALAEALPDGCVRVALLDPVMGVAPGQAVVLYDGTRVVGSATIRTTTTAGQPASSSSRRS